MSAAKAEIIGWRVRDGALSMSADFGLVVGEIEVPSGLAREIALSVLSAQAEHLYWIPPNESMREPNPDNPGRRVVS